MSQSLNQDGSPTTQGSGLPLESKDKGPATRMFWHRSPLVSEDDFEYRPLKEATTIRLIRVCRKKVDGLIACRIYHFDKNTQWIARYHALSYVWGDSDDTKRMVYLRGRGTDWHPFRLHENLWRFLDYVWRHKQFTRLFWTDKICLDQKSHEEKAQQIPRMFAIYRNAALVVAWLQSPEQEQEHPGLTDIVRWSDGLKPAQIAWPYESLVNLERRFYEFDDHGAWEQLMRNEYWERAWIVQEVIAAKKVCVTFEDVSIDFDKIPALLIPYRRDCMVGMEMVAQERVFWTLFKNRAGVGKIPLWRILLDCDQYECSQPADRLYGFLGILSDHDDGSSPADHIKIDYDKPIMHVFLDALFESSPPLEWYHVGYLPPSWGVPAGQLDTISRLESYIMSSRTTQRHRTLATSALQALEGFLILGVVLHKPHCPDELDKLLESVAYYTKLKPTLEQSAALIGIMLAHWCESNAETAEDRDVLIANRLRRGLASSPWRCDAHRGYIGPRSPRSYDVVIGRASAKWDREVCGKKSQACDASAMTFEIPEIGFRMLLESRRVRKARVGERPTSQQRRHGFLSLLLVGIKDRNMERLKIARWLGQDWDLPD